MAPAFSLTAGTGEEISLKGLKGQVVVLYFYPRDNTPGCTQEACSFRDLTADFAAAGAVILGVSRDSATSHANFAERQSLNFPLLSDPEAEVCAAYGVYKEKRQYGRTFMGIERTTFVIDAKGIIRRIYPKVKVDQHADEVLQFVKSLA
jgi:peroxiredoxin Q/BCP